MKVMLRNKGKGYGSRTPKFERICGTIGSEYKILGDIKEDGLEKRTLVAERVIKMLLY